MSQRFIDRRVLFVLPFPVWGAAEDYALAVTSGLGQRGWQVALAHPLALSLPDRHVDEVASVLLPDSLARLSRLLTIQRPALIHVNQVYLPALAAARLTRSHPIVVTAHTPALRVQLSMRGRLLEAFAKPTVDRWITLSQSNRELLAKSRAISDEVISVVHPGLSRDRFNRLPTRSAAVERLGIDPGGLIIGTVGRLADQKRHDILIDAFARASKRVPSLKLLIIGEGELSSATQAFAEAHAPGQVVFTGHRSDVIECLSAIDIFAMSSDFEGLPFALLEAMATGRPIVTTDVQGAGEAVRDGLEGLVVPRRDPEALSAAILRLAGDPALARGLGAAARVRFLAEFDAEQMIDRTEAIYTELLERGSR